jgi:hypothetical protein
MKQEEREKLLEEAKIRYPVGTVFRCLHGCQGVIAEYEAFRDTYEFLDKLKKELF